MELRHLRYFVVLAEQLNFRRSAEQLHMAQPALSRQIKHLEDELEVTLLVRTRRQVQLTEAGRTFFDEAKTILAATERAVRATRRASRGKLGELTIGCTQATAVSLFPLILPVYQRLFPRVSVAVETLDTPHQVDALASRRIQVGFLRLPCSDEGFLQTEVVLREPLVVVLPKSHTLAGRR